MTAISHTPNSTVSGAAPQGVLSGTKLYRQMFEAIFDQMGDANNYTIEPSQSQNPLEFTIQYKLEITSHIDTQTNLRNATVAARSALHHISQKYTKDLSNPRFVGLGLQRKSIDPQTILFRAIYIFPEASHSEDVAQFIKKHRTELVSQAMQHFRSDAGCSLQ